MLSLGAGVQWRGNIRDQLVGAAKGKRWASIPAFAKTVTPVGFFVPVLDEDAAAELVEVSTRRTTRDTVSIGMIRRECTADFKIVPIRRKLRALAGLTRKRSPGHAVVEQWIGVSRDEIMRVKPSRGRDANEPAGLPRLAAPPRLPSTAEIGLHRVSVS